ncbi:helix-turn-helix domain-containing protein [Vibrio alginolyticus]|uniref:helix-turn-helix domain-containing protein n=1 Tax=Vibrio alginolyticus TaxID=663 RepID=UPI003D7DBFD9
MILGNSRSCFTPRVNRTPELTYKVGEFHQELKSSCESILKDNKYFNNYSIVLIEEKQCTTKNVYIVDNYNANWKDNDTLKTYYQFILSNTVNKCHPYFWTWESPPIKVAAKKIETLSTIDYGVTVSYIINNYVKCIISLSSSNNNRDYNRDEVRFLTDSLNYNVVNVVDKYNVLKKSKNVSLTKIESDILRLSADGYTSREIADIIHRTKSSVDFHLHNIMKKTGSKNKVQAVAYALKVGLL